MITFQVNDMTCGHCASAISRAVAGVDQEARLDIRIEQKLVLIASTASRAELAEAIRTAGYTPQEIRDEPAQAAPAGGAGGCGCGCASRKAAAVDIGQSATPRAASCCR